MRLSSLSELRTPLQHRSKSRSVRDQPGAGLETPEQRLDQPVRRPVSLVDLEQHLCGGRGPRQRCSISCRRLLHPLRMTVGSRFSGSYRWPFPLRRAAERSSIGTGLAAGGWRLSSVIAMLSAPTNLGLRPPQAGSVPGCAKAPEALREAGLHRRLLDAGAIDAGVVLPGRYIDDGDAAAGRVRNQDALVDHARRLAGRVGQLLDAGQSPLVLGGDCSLLLGAGLALARRGRHGLVHVDGHTDFRHPGNSDACRSVAGEDLAAAIGLHWPALADLDGYRPYFTPSDAAHLGCRDDDEHLPEAQQVLGGVLPASRVQQDGVQAAARTAESVAGRPQLLATRRRRRPRPRAPACSRQPRPRRPAPRRAHRAPGGLGPRRAGSAGHRIRPRPRPGRTLCRHAHRGAKHGAAPTRPETRWSLKLPTDRCLASPSPRGTTGTPR